ncbi:hypothetical protein NDU88_004761 [Pleurodeles waltl]|uniref:Helitron helicase-like domain-containing protein n=1 Tax=Pleurodeles waltl TaxID=8319 RepID=A0AAV7T9B1_PLEWA|nr:hypothetical protein NDU88_004761 [Pleurodeles waltl]
MQVDRPRHCNPGANNIKTPPNNRRIDLEDSAKHMYVIREYANNDIKGKKKSNRMFLFSNPTFMPELIQELKTGMTIFNENDARRLMEQIKKVLRFSLCSRNTPHMIDVFTRETGSNNSDFHELQQLSHTDTYSIAYTDFK